MSREKRIETSPNHSLPNSLVASIPTPAEPMVLAMVLRERMAASGLSVSVLKVRMSCADLAPSSSRKVM